MDFRFRKISYTPFARLPGFSKSRGHFVPERPSSAALDFARTLLDPNVQEELQLVYQRSKDVLALRHRQVKKNAEKSGGNVETEFFRYSFFLTQDEADPSQVKTVREVALLKGREELPAGLDLVFPDAMEEIVFEFENPGFDELVEHFEEVRDKWGGRLKDDETKGIIDYVTDVLALEADTKTNEMVIRPVGATGCLPLLEIAQEYIATIGEALHGNRDPG